MLLVIALHVGLLARGYVGVDIFFALSGFLITLLLLEEWDGTGAISLRRFYARRARRLVPALLVLVVAFTIIVVAFDPFSGLWPLGRLIVATLLFQNNWVSTLAPAHGHVLGPLSPTWSLAQEGQFYLLWPPVLMILLRLRVRPGVVVGLLALTSLALLAAVPFLRHAYPAYNPYTSPLDRGAELLLGCAVAVVWRHGLVPRILRARLTGWLLAAGLAFLVAGSGDPSATIYLPASVLAALLIVNLLAAADEVRPGRLPERGLLTALLAAPPLRYSGKVSYGLYLYHLPIYYLLWLWLPGRSPLFYAAIVVPAALLAAGVSFRSIERPALRLRLPRLRLRHRAQRVLAYAPEIGPSTGSRP